MPFSATITAPGLEQWKKDGFATAKSLSNPQLVRNVSTVLTKRFQTLSKHHFSRLGSFGAHGAWPPLSDAYGQWKRKHFPGKPLMRREDKLFDSLTSDSPDSISRGTNAANGFIFRFGSQVEYAEYHQKGKGKLPMRKVIDPKRQQLRGIGVSIARTLEEGMFSRRWFEIKGQGLTKVSIRYTGFESVDIP